MTSIMTPSYYPALPSPDPNAWSFAYSEPLPSPPLSLYSVDGIDPTLARHAAATAFQRDMYALRTKQQHAKIPEELEDAIEVLDVSRLIARPENLSLRVEFPTGVKHLRLKNTQIDITASLRAASAVESVVQFVDMTWGRTAFASAPVPCNELVFNLNYPPQRACRLDATPKFAVGHVTVILRPGHASSAGPHKMLVQDIQDLVAAVALQNNDNGSMPVCTIVCDALARAGPLRWEMPGRGGSDATRRFLLGLRGQDPNAALEIVDMETYRARVGEEAFARNTVW